VPDTGHTKISETTLRIPAVSMRETLIVQTRESGEEVLDMYVN
jgi:hypothetical protein